MAAYESFESNDRTMTMTLDEDADTGGENSRRFRYSRFYLLFCNNRHLSTKKEIISVLKKTFLPLSILTIIILILFIAFLNQVLHIFKLLVLLFYDSFPT